ncbi:MAG TPA: VWA domain-containing protein [Vicinamibacterales bacterium]
MTRSPAWPSLCAAVALAAPPAAQQATFSSRLEAVRVDVAVTERGRPVAGLGADDFELFDNGVRQTVQLIVSDEIPIDLVMALDISDSVTGERLEHLRRGSQAALDALTQEDRAALLTFTQRVMLRVPLTGDTAAIAAALDRESLPGTTSMIDAAYAALAHADAGRGRGLAIVLSDGVDTASWLTADSVVETARRMDAVLFGISAGTRRAAALGELADATGGDVIRIASTAELSVALRSLIDSFRQRYLLSFVPQGVARGGWHRLDVRAKRRGLSVKARAGYFGS